MLRTHIIAWLFACLVCTAVFSLPAAQAHMSEPYKYIFKVSTPHTTEPLSGLRAYYKGRSINLEEGWCLLKEDQDQVSFALVCTQDVDLDASQRVLKRNPDEPCRWFYLVRETKTSASDAPYAWRVEELSKQDMPYILPSNALIVCINPDIVDTPVAEDVVDTTSYVYIPSLRLKGDIPAAKLRTALEEAQQAALKLDSFHEREREVAQTIPQGKMSFTQ